MIHFSTFALQVSSLIFDQLDKVRSLYALRAWLTKIVVNFVVPSMNSRFHPKTSQFLIHTATIILLYFRIISNLIWQQCFCYNI